MISSFSVPRIRKPTSHNCIRGLFVRATRSRAADALGFLRAVCHGSCERRNCIGSKTFGPTVALNGVSLRAYEGEVHAIVGGNGSGKSTLAKVISGVLIPDSGRVSIFGKSASSPVEAKAIGIANVYQEVLVTDECSVLDNLDIGAKICSVRTSGKKRRSEKPLC